MSTPRILFDRSAFHGSHFDHLQNSSLIRLVQANKLRVFHTPIFIEETIRMRLNEKLHQTLRDQFPFIQAICNGGWFVDRSTLWDRELVQHLCEKTNPVMSPQRQRSHEARVSRFAIEGETDHFSFADAVRDHERNYGLAAEMRKTFVHMREDAANRAKAKGIAISLGNANFERVMGRERESYLWEVVG